jgi:hypothetical protein
MEVNHEKLNDELLKVEEEGSPKKVKVPKRGSKDKIIHNILKIDEEYNLELEYSDTTLRRMNKEKLTKVLAECMERCVKIDMAKSVGVDPRANGKCITLGALRMLHNLCATGFERSFNAFGSKYVGYEVEGFASSMNDPAIQSSVDEILTEIAAENPEVLQYFDSPYTRLALIWSGALIQCLKKKRLRENGMSNMEPTPRARPAPSRPSSGRKPPVRKEHSNLPPRVPNVVEV